MNNSGPTKRMRTAVARTATATLIIALLIFWAWAFLLYEPPGNPDRLEDRNWTTAAEQLCALAVSSINNLPAAIESPSPKHRADVIDRATLLLNKMVENLGALTGGTDRDLDLIDKWLDDWSIYLNDRSNYAHRLRTEGDVRPYLTALPSGAGSYVDRMNGFARVNDIQSCLDPGDI